MSIFRCNVCDEQIDSDFHDCHEDPKDKCELICGNCLSKLRPISGNEVSPKEIKDNFNVDIGKKGQEKESKQKLAYCEICDERMVTNPKESPICFKCLERNWK